MRPKPLQKHNRKQNKVHADEICQFQSTKHEPRRQRGINYDSNGQSFTFPALIKYCRIDLGSLMIDLGKARTAETNFPIAR